MYHFTVIRDLVVILLVSIPIIFIFKKIHIPSIVGFLIAGMIIGPHGLQLISELNEINIMAEVGVILLLFTIGLEVKLEKLIEMKKFLMVSGGLQVLTTLIFSTLIFSFFDFPLNESIFLSMLISLSSTAIVLKILSDRQQLEAPHGRISLSILIFQDLAIVPMFLFLPVLSSGGKLSFLEISLQMVYAFGAVAIIILLAKFLMPKILYQLAKLRMREVFTIGVVLLLLGTAYLTHALGLSFALGAFIAGLILSESDFSHQVVSEVLPFKDLFNSIFFISIGLLLDIHFLITYPLILIGIAAGIIFLKSFIVIGIVKIMRYPLRIAILTGFGLAQIGEFSFILSQAGLNFNLISNEYYNAFLASSIFTMLLTPFLFQLSPIIVRAFGTFEPVKIKEPKGLSNHVIIVGFGLNGRNLARVLKETGIHYTVIELNPETVKKEKLKGENILYGDITKEQILNQANIENANTIVFAISDPASLRRGLNLAKKINPSIYSIVRTRFASDIDDLLNLGADEAIPEEFETSIQIFSIVLKRFHVPLNVIMQQVNLLRSEAYSLMRKEPGKFHALSNINEFLMAGVTEVYYVKENNLFANSTLSEINLRAKTDATIIAIVREKQTVTNPSGKEIIKVHDTLVITGTHKAVDDAIEYLNSD
ncbi:MAG: cation:proton antiporter [Ignavibacteriaceae bacterium]